MNEIAHPTTCLCISCAPISTPTRSPSINSTLAAEPDVELAQAAVLFKGLGRYERRIALAHLAALDKLQGKR